MKMLPLRYFIAGYQARLRFQRNPINNFLPLFQNKLADADRQGIG